MKLDEALVGLGDFGRYQTLVYLFICLAGQVPSAWHMLAISFLGATPEHHCRVPTGDRLEDTVPTVGTEEPGTITAPTTEFFECDQYANLTVDNSTLHCSHGWNYDTKYYGTTITTEWDLVCDKDGSIYLSQAIFMAGVLVGSLLFGHLSDRFGRRPVFFLSLWAQVAFGVGVAFTGNFYAFLIVRFFVGVIEQGVDITSYVMVTEMFSPSRRAFAGILLTLFWASGIMSMSGLAYLLTDWRHLQLAISLPNLLTIPLWWVIPESTRWLLSRGRVQEAEVILYRIARFNNVELPENVLTTDTNCSPDKQTDRGTEETATDIKSIGFVNQAFTGTFGLSVASSSISEMKNTIGNPDDLESKEGASKTNQAGTVETSCNTASVQHGTYSLWHLIKTPRIRTITLVMVFTWCVNSLVYYGLSLNTDLVGNPYLNFFLSGAVEIPAYIVSTAVVTWFGRRLPLCVFHIVAGIACIATVFIPGSTESGTDLSAIIVTVAMLGKFGIAGSYAIVFLYATELFPTVVRNIGLGISSFSSRVGGILAPIVKYLANFVEWLPMVAFGGLSVIAGLSVLILHETLGKKQPQTINEVENRRPDI